MNLKYEQLKRFQALPINQKIALSERRIDEWYRYFNGKVYVSFSGGKDSTVLLHIVRKLFPDVPAVFVNTGLEYPEIKQFVKTIDNVIWLKPKMNFKKVIERYGYPVISKRVSRALSDIKNASEKNKATVNLRLSGYNRKGIYCPSMKLAEKWKYLINSPFKISDKCCEIIKKNPLNKYIKLTSQYPITGIMASESSMRMKDYITHGCNSFNTKIPISKPIVFWTEKNIWQYIRDKNIAYSEIYNMGELRTGCMFCMFGYQFEEPGKTRFDRMKKSHPKIYNYCMNKLNLKMVLKELSI